MNTTGKYIPLPNGSLVFLEPDTSSFSTQDGIRRRVSYATHFLGKKEIVGKHQYSFRYPDWVGDSTVNVAFSIPEESEEEEWCVDLRAIGGEFAQILNQGNLLVFYPAEQEEVCLDILTLLILSQQPFANHEEMGLSPKPLGKTREAWKEKFLRLGFQIFRERVSHTQHIEMDSRGTKPQPKIPQGTTESRSAQPIPSRFVAKPPEKIEPIQVKTVPDPRTTPTIESTYEFKPEARTVEGSERSRASEVERISQTKDEFKLEPISEPKVESKIDPNPEIKMESKIEPIADRKPDSKLEPSTQPSTESRAEEISSHDIRTRFSIQIKMMGIISLILAGTAATIIGAATYFFKDDSEKRVQENSLAMVDLVGLKVSSDIQGIVIKGEQLVQSLIRPNLTKEDRRFITDLFFSNDKDFIFVGLYTQSENALKADRTFYNENNLIDANLSEDEVESAVVRNQENIMRAFTGKPIIINSTPGFSQQSFILALPANVESTNQKILVIMVKLEKILPAFEKKGIVTTFMVNDEGRAIAHPVEDVIVAATIFMDLPIVKSMLASQVDNGQTRYMSSEGKPFLGSYRKVGFGDAGIISIISEDKAFEAVYNIQERNIYIVAISLCLALIIVFFFAKSISRPILSLLWATLEIAKGNFRIGIRPTTNDEVGLLTKYFITMGEGLEEREKVKNILGSMIDPVVVKEAMVDLAALKRGKEAEITSFFSDVAGFSTISEQLTSVELASLLNEYLSAMTILLKENEGVLDKYIGDAIVGIFGAPVDVHNHAVKACKASLEMVAKLEDLRQYWQKNNLYSREAQIMDARIGLNTGPAKVGFMGTDALASYTMMGDTVNLAARLEAAGKDYGVNIMIAENTNRLVQTEMATRILDLVRVKGKNEPVRVYELVAFRNSIPGNLADAIGHYEQGFELYLRGNFNEAIKQFESVIQAKGGKDKSSKMLIERCKDYLKQPPGSDWDGVFTRTTK